MKFSANEPMAWLQHALCLITSGKHAHGLAVLREATNQDPASVSPCLVAARACYEHLGLVNYQPIITHTFVVFKDNYFYKFVFLLSRYLKD